MKVHRPGISTIFRENLLQYGALLLLFIALLQRLEGFIFLSLLVLVMVNGAKLWAKASLTKVSGKLSSEQKKAFPNDIIKINIQLKNNKLLPVWLGFRLKLPNSNEDREEGTGMLWFQKVIWQRELILEKRGVYNIGPGIIQGGDLLGLFKTSQELIDTLTVTVYPKLIPLNRYSFPMVDLYGDIKGKSPVEDILNIVGTKDYQWGTSAKNIHWKASARYGTLHEKIFEPTINLKVYLILEVKDFTAHNDYVFEQTLEVIASLARLLIGEGIPVGLIVNGTIIGKGSLVLPLSNGDHQITAILETLAKLEMQQKDKLENIIKANNINSGVTCIYFAFKIDRELSRTAEYVASSGKSKNIFVYSQNSSINNTLETKVYRLHSLLSKEEDK